MQPIVIVENLSKQYRLGTQSAAYSTIRESLTNRIRGRRNGSGKDQMIWALRDVQFEIAAGEVLGIIGRNGAGKSTLLKILSRVTEPTTGRVVLHGRVGSLLEVGTGFHPELTGRENVFLNGSILGMSRKEILGRFDEIVSFAEIEKFVDTPVKRYSSGMYLRLAFAVAANLRPEILVVDEVLAVGDANFQKKCLGKMGDIARDGRTVIFVSHNMSAVQRLCTRALLVDAGRIMKDGPVADTISSYLGTDLSQQAERIFTPDRHQPHFPDGTVQLERIRALDANESSRSAFDVKEPVHIEVEYRVLIRRHTLNVHLYFRNEAGDNIFVSMDNLDSPFQDEPAAEGLYRARCTVPANLLNAGSIRVEYLICTRPTSPQYVTFPDAISLNITDDMEEQGVRGNWIREWPQSLVRPRLQWTVERADA